MSFENVSPQMQERFELLDEMIEQGYIKPVKPVASWLPTLCYYPQKTAAFNNASQELKRQFNKNMFSWYGFFLPSFAFTQTRLAKDFYIVLCIYTTTITIFWLLPEYSGSSLTNVTGLVLRYFMSQIFVFSRYYQYKSHGRCPSNRNIFSTICLSIIYLCLAVIPRVIIQSIFSIFIIYFNAK